MQWWGCPIPGSPFALCLSRCIRSASIARHRRPVVVRRLLRHRDFRWLWMSQIVSTTGDYISRVALAGLLYERSGSAALTAVATVVTVLPWAAGPVINARFAFLSQRSLMLWADGVRMVLFALIALGPPTPVALGMALLAGMCTPPFEAARAAVLAEAVPDEADYVAARIVAQVTFQSTSVVGLVAGGLLLVHVGAQTALLADAATYGLSMGCVAALGVGRASGVLRPAVLQGLRAGYRAVFVDRLVRSAALLPVLGMAGATAVEALLVGFAGERNALHTVGLLAATVPVSTLITTALLNRFLSSEHQRLLTVAHVVTAIGCIVAAAGFALPRMLVTDLLAFAGAGMTFAATAPLVSVVGLRVRREDQSAAFSLLQSTLRLGEACVAGAAAAMTLVLDVTTTLFILSVVSLLFTVGSSLLLREARDKRDRAPSAGATRSEWPPGVQDSR